MRLIAPETVVLGKTEDWQLHSNKKFLLGNNKDEYEKAKFSYLESKANLVNTSIRYRKKKAKTLKLRTKISRVKRIEFLRKRRVERKRKIKLQRAYGECLGTWRRRRTWQAAKSCGEEQISKDPQISEWGNSTRQTRVIVYWIDR